MKKSHIPIATAHRYYVVEVAALMAVYTVVLCVSLKLIPSVSHRWLQVMIALMPVVPVAFVLVSVIRLFSRVDEMFRRIHLEAAALTAGGTALIGLTCGFLQNVGLPALSGFWTFGVVNALYMLFVLILRWRYR